MTALTGVNYKRKREHIECEEKMGENDSIDEGINEHEAASGESCAPEGSSLQHLRDTDAAREEQEAERIASGDGALCDAMEIVNACPFSSGFAHRPRDSVVPLQPASDPTLLSGHVSEGEKDALIARCIADARLHEQNERVSIHEASAFRPSSPSPCVCICTAISTPGSSLSVAHG